MRVSGGAAGGRVDRARDQPRPRDPARPALARVRALLPRPRRRPGLRTGPGDLPRLRRGQPAAASSSAWRRRHLLRRLLPAGASSRPPRRERRTSWSSTTSRRSCAALSVILRNAGYDVATRTTKPEALDAVAVRPPDAIVLDLVLPDGSGVDVCREVRGWSSAADHRALGGGRRAREGARARRRRRRLRHQAVRHRRAARPAARGAATRGRRAEEPVVESRRARRSTWRDRRVTRGGEEIHLTPIEFDILRVLARHSGKLVTHRQLLQEVWGPGYDRRDALPARPRRAHPRQDRARPVASDAT